MTDLSKKRDLERLAIQRAPHWQKLSAGNFLGFHRGKTGTSWHARHRTRDGRQLFTVLDASDFETAKPAAEAWFKQLGATVRTVHRGTVADAVDAYLTYLRQQGQESTAKNQQRALKSVVSEDAIATVILSKLTKEDVRDWRERVGQRPGPKGAGKIKPRSVNRHARNLVAALNCAVSECGHTGNPLAWDLKALADDVDSGETTDTAVFLSRELRAALIANVEHAETAALLRGLEFTGARPKELVQATVGDFDAKGRTLRLTHWKGRPPRPRVRIVVLGSEAVAFFTAQSKNKLPKALLFPSWRPRGGVFERHDYADDIVDARAAHNKTARGENRLPKNATAYVFRHARISELLQLHGVDPLTVAAQTGTSVKMLEKFYYKFISAAQHDKLAALSA